MRSAIQEAGGIEIFAVGEVDSKGEVQSIEVHARGTQDAVLALRSRPRAGQVVIHNHPSGVVRPSAADTELAGTFGEGGGGFVIVDNAVSRAQWVVEPHKKRRVRVDPAEVDAIFLKKLPALMPGWEARPGQVELAHRVLGTFNDGGTVLLEAGTGTGKSLGYLVPAGLWALANDAKVLVSTYTKTLQGQLLSEDLPLLARLLPLRYAALKGRSNYVCRRKLGLAGTEEPLEAIRAWAATTATGDREDLGLEIDEDLWDRIQSDTDQTL
ncbi:MAG TPA: JAB domain-containing protein, partial [Myxococcota bacterium]|nr:JAB domain-containing protein [Myxococcota bacterium]